MTALSAPQQWAETGYPASEAGCPLCEGIEFACFPIHLHHPSPFCSACGRSIPVRLVHLPQSLRPAGT